MCNKCTLKVGDTDTHLPDDSGRYSTQYVEQLLKEIDSLETEVDDLKHELFCLEKL